MAQWLIYAMGGGFGHLTRAVALARVAPLYTRVRILTNSAYASWVQRVMPDLDMAAIDPALPVAAGRARVIQEIGATAPDCLIVDTFPRGLAGELVHLLPGFGGLRVLVQRDLNPEYTAAFDLEVFVRDRFDLVMNPGDGDDATTAPWLVRSQNELLTRDQARQVLCLCDDRPCVVICAAGNADELNWYGSVAALLSPSAQVRCIAATCPTNCPPECWYPYWPAIDLYAAADVVVGGAGYNTVSECLACGVPLVARPWPRKYDRQALRARRASVVTVNEPEEAAAAVLKLPGTARTAHFENGAVEAAARIAASLASNPRS